MAITNVGLSFYGSESADYSNRVALHATYGETPIYLKWRTTDGMSVISAFDIAVNYRVVPKVSIEGGGISGWATDWSTWMRINAEACNQQRTEGEAGYQWSQDLATLLNVLDLRNLIMPGLEFDFQERFYDRIEVGVHIKAHYQNSNGEDAVSPRTDAVMTIDYVPEYWIKSVYCDSLDYVKIKYEYSEEWLRSDDRFCVESMKIVDENGENGAEIAASKPWGTVTLSDEEGSDGFKVAVATIPMSSLSDVPIGEALYVHLRFNPSYGASGDEFAQVVINGMPCEGGGIANIPELEHEVRDGVLRITPHDSDAGGTPVDSVFMKLVGSGHSFDQQTVQVDTESAWPYVPRGEAFTIRAVGMDVNGSLSEVRTVDMVVSPSAPVEIVSLRDPSIRAMARYDLNISDDCIPESESIKLAGRERECTYYGIGGSATWNLSASLVKSIAGQYDTEAAWRNASMSGDCVLLLSDGTRGFVSFDSIRFNRNHPGATPVSVTLREVDAS